MQRIPHEQLPVLKGEINNLQKYGDSEPSISIVANPVIIVLKTDGTIKLCIDYTNHNAMHDE